MLSEIIATYRKVSLLRYSDKRSPGEASSTLPPTPDDGNVPCSGVQNVQYTEALNTFSERSVHLLYRVLGHTDGV